MQIQDQQWGFIREDRDARLRNDVDPKTMEAFNTGTKLSAKWKKYRQALLDLPSQDVDNVGDLVWPTKPE